MPRRNIAPTTIQRETVILSLPSKVVDVLVEEAGKREWPFDRLMAWIISDWLSAQITKERAEAEAATPA